MVKYKNCKKCDTVKEVTEFYLNQGKYYSYQCKRCVNKRLTSKKERTYLIPIDLEGEVWKECEGFEKYKISNLGRIKSFTRRTIGTILRFRYNHYGYVFYSLVGKKNSIYAHRLVATAFIPNPKNKPFVNHINGIKNDNRVENLEWCTSSENQIHAHLTGLKISKKGQNHKMSKLTDVDVLKLREEHLKIEGKKEILKFLSNKSLEYSVNKRTIQLIINRKTWRHI